MLDTPAPRFRLGYRSALDGIRGLAVLLVTANHLKIPFFQNGYLGVDFFFTLSGFLITSILAEEWITTGKIGLKNFYIRRLLRLYPALLAMLLIVSPITHATPYLLSSVSYTTNWMMALQLQPLNLELGHTWTLAIEEQYYLLWPLLLIFLLHRLPPRRAVLVPLALAGLSALTRVLLWANRADFWRFNAGTDAHADGLFLGSALGLAAAFNLLPRSQWLSKPPWATLNWVLAGVFLTAAAAVPLAAQSSMVALGSLGAVLITLLMILNVTVYPTRWVQRMLEFRPIVLAGMVSYGLYLWQVPVINLINLDSFTLPPWGAGAIKLTLTLAFTLLSYRYLERPIVRLKSRFAPSHPKPVSPSS